MRLDDENRVREAVSVIQRNRRRGCSPRPPDGVLDRSSSKTRGWGVGEGSRTGGPSLTTLSSTAMPREPFAKLAIIEGSLIMGASRVGSISVITNCGCNNRNNNNK